MYGNLGNGKIKTSINIIVVAVLSFPFVQGLQSQTQFVPTTVTVLEDQKNLKLTCPLRPTSFYSILWIPQSNPSMIIGGGVSYNTKRYTYLASTGQLLLKDVSFADQGMYTCIMRHGSGTNVTVSGGAVNLVVKKSYSMDQENKDNLVRAAIASGFLFVTVSFLCFTYSCRHKPKETSSGTVSHTWGNYNVSLAEATSSQEHPAITSIDAPSSKVEEKANTNTAFSREEEEAVVPDPPGLPASPDPAETEDAISLQSISNGPSHRKTLPDTSESSLVSISVGVNRNVGEVRPAGSTIIYITTSD